jgi:hypothetical protein
MRVVLQGLAPGVENHGHAELGAEMPGISGDDGKCLGRRAAFKKTLPSVWRKSVRSSHPTHR